MDLQVLASVVHDENHEAILKLIDETERRLLREEEDKDIKRNRKKWE